VASRSGLQYRCGFQVQARNPSSADHRRIRIRQRAIAESCMGMCRTGSRPEAPQARQCFCFADEIRFRFARAIQLLPGAPE